MGMFWCTGDTYFTVLMAYQEHNSNTTSWCHSGQLPLICTPHKKHPPDCILCPVLNLSLEYFMNCKVSLGALKGASK